MPGTFEDFFYRYLPHRPVDPSPIPLVGSSIGTRAMADSSNEKIPDPVGGHQEPVDDEEKLGSSALDSTESVDDIQQLKKTEALEVSGE